MKGFIQAKGAGRVAARRGVQQLFTDELAFMAVSTVAVDENTCMIFDSHGPSQ
jgi:hypothetical protein